MNTLIKSNIILTGMPGAGKSTIGKLLSNKMKRNFIDTDLLILNKEKRNLQDIVSNDGLEAFLSIEENVITGLDVENSIIATGGSVIYSGKAMEHLKKKGIIIYLDLKLHQLRQRLKNASTRGIAKKSGQTLENLYHERLPLYKSYADIIIDCSHKHIGTITDEVKRRAEALLTI